MNKQILYFYNPRCGHCNAFDNASKDFFRDNINTNKDIELLKFSSEDIKNGEVYFDEEILDMLEGTPIFLFIENGKPHTNLTVIGNNLSAFIISFNIFMKVNENIESKVTIKAEGICAKVHKLETTTEALKPTCVIHKTEEVKPTCGVNKSNYEAHNYEDIEDRPTNICEKPKTDQ